MDKYVVCIIASGFTDQIRCLITALNIRENYNRTVKLDILWFKEYGKDYLGIEKRQLEILNVFDDLNFEIATEEEINIAKESLFIDGRYGENVDELLNLDKYIYIGGYVCHLYNFKKQIDISSILNPDKYFCKFLLEHHKNILNDIDAYESVALHIRRGDYLYALKMSNIKNNVSINYIIKSINYFYDNYKNVKIFIFSNNNEYIDSNIVPLMKLHNFQYKVVQNNKEYVDFYLISKCKHTISTLGKFAEVAFMFNNNSNKIFINTNNISDILPKDFKNKKEKYFKYICERYINISGEIFDYIKSNISPNNMLNIFNLIYRNKINNICQIGILDGLETHSLLKYSVSNKKFNIHCFESNERDISGIEIRNFSKEEKKLFKLYNNSTPLDCENILDNNIFMDIILFTKEISNPLALIYLIYLFPYMNNEIIIILTDLSNNLYDSFNNFIFNISNCEKEIFYNYEENKYDNVGYIKITKNELLNIIKLASNNKFDNNNIIFYDKIMDLREDYFNFFDIEKGYYRLKKLQKYMNNKFDIDYSNYIMNNLYNSLDIYIKNIYTCNSTENKEYELNYIKLEINNILSSVKNEINNAVNCSNIINKKFDTLISLISWWIPIKKWRDSFRAKFKIADQTRPDQTRPDQTRPNRNM